jgi:hypothetical protein
VTVPFFNETAAWITAGVGLVAAAVLAAAVLAAFEAKGLLALHLAASAPTAGSSGPPDSR